MKYKLLKDLPWAKAGTIVDADFTRSGNGNISYSFIAQHGECEGKEAWQGWYPRQYGDWNDWFEEVDERWKPCMNEAYFFFENYGKVIEDKWSFYCDEMIVDEERWKMGNCFRTRELAEEAAEQIKALLKEFHKNNP